MRRRHGVEAREQVERRRHARGGASRHAMARAAGAAGVVCGGVRRRRCGSRIVLRQRRILAHLRAQLDHVVALHVELTTQGGDGGVQLGDHVGRGRRWSCCDRRPGGVVLRRVRKELLLQWWRWRLVPLLRRGVKVSAVGGGGCRGMRAERDVRRRAVRVPVRVVPLTRRVLLLMLLLHLLLLVRDVAVGRRVRRFVLVVDRRSATMLAVSRVHWASARLGRGVRRSGRVLGHAFH